MQQYKALKVPTIDEMVGSDALAIVRPTGVYLLDFLCSGIQFHLLLSPYLCLISFLYLDLYILGDDANQTSMCLDPLLD